MAFNLSMKCGANSDIWELNSVCQTHVTVLHLLSSSHHRVILRAARGEWIMGLQSLASWDDTWTVCFCPTRAWEGNPLPSSVCGGDLDNCRVDTQERREKSPVSWFQICLRATWEVDSKHFKILQRVLSRHIKGLASGERIVTDALQITLLSGFVDSSCCFVWLPADLSLKPCLGLTPSPWLLLWCTSLHRQTARTTDGCVMSWTPLGCKRCPSPVSAGSTRQGNTLPFESH